MAFAYAVNIIAERNDRLRMSLPCVSKPDAFVITQGIACKPAEEQAEIMKMVKEFSDFNQDNDPYHAHEFGSFIHAGDKIFWKIDDYAGAEGLRLVLTVMLAEEY